MALSKSEEAQQELFTQFSDDPKKTSGFIMSSRPQKPILITTSPEQIILISILLILLSCFMFFLGLIRGKASANKNVTASAEVMVQEEEKLSPNIQAPVQPLAQNKTPIQTVTTAAPTTALKSKPLSQPSPDLNKPYTIQLVTYKTQGQALSRVAEFKKKGLFATVIPSGDYYQVCVGQYLTKEHAQKDLKTFGLKYKDCFLRRR